VIFNNRMPQAQGFLGVVDPGETSSFSETGPLPPNGEIDSRLGDVITFGGPATDRFVTSFSTRLWSFEQPVTPITVSVELSLYTVLNNLPNQLLWQGTVSNVLLSTNQPVIVNFAPNLLVPDTIAFGIGFPSVSGTRSFGVVSSTGLVPGRVGTSPATTLLQDTATQAWRVQNLGQQFGGIFNDAEALVVATPSPGTATLLAIALPVLRRRSRRFVSR
jgi:hypothetical protein